MESFISSSLIFLFIVVSLCSCYNESYNILEIEAKNPTAFTLVYGVRQADGTYNFEVDKENSKSQKSKSGDIVAGGWIIADNNKTGWAYQIIRSSNLFNDTMQAYWAGYVEGQTASNLTKAQFRNTLADFCPKPYSSYCIRLASYLSANMVWMKNEVVEKRSKDPFWHQVELQLWQIKGLQDAYKNQVVKNSKELSLNAFKTLDFSSFEVYLLQLSGDMGDLEAALNKPGARAHMTDNGRCSALIKLLPGNRDLYTAHDTWSTYQSMLRVLKHYDLPFHVTAQSGSPIIPGRKMSFSSYPSTASSIDDFYIMDSGLVSTETTNGNYNTSLWNIVRNGANRGVFEFLRVQVANRLAMNGSDWVKYFSRNNSGTYNNQWMVVDYKNFKQGQPLPNTGVLTVAEQLPGIVVSKDLTRYLQENRYWASYNIPAFKEIYDMAEYPSQVKKYGDWFTHSGAPRSRIFKRDQSKVKDLESMMRIMRYNNFEKDPLSRCKCTPPYSAENAISARCDLNPANGTYPFSALGHRAHGGIDMKVTNTSMVQQLNFVAIAGPTYDQVPAFEWSKADFGKTTPHFMHPDKFAFPPVLTPFYPKNMKRNFRVGSRPKSLFDRL